MGGEDIMPKTIQEDLPATWQAPVMCSVVEAHKLLCLHSVIAVAALTGLQRHPLVPGAARRGLSHQP